MPVALVTGAAKRLGRSIALRLAQEGFVIAAQYNTSRDEAEILCEEITGRKMSWSYTDTNRIGDHIWWISDLRAFKRDYPEWKLHYDVETILQEIYEANSDRWKKEAS